jgi:hypothetical protein
MLTRKKLHPYASAIEPVLEQNWKTFPLPSCLHACLGTCSFSILVWGNMSLTPSNIGRGLCLRGRGPQLWWPRDRQVSSWVCGSSIFRESNHAVSVRDADGRKPGCMVCLTSWYTRKELALRTAVLYCGSLISGAFSGLIAAGITSGLDGLVLR